MGSTKSLMGWAPEGSLGVSRPAPKMKVRSRSRGLGVETDIVREAGAAAAGDADAEAAGGGGDALLGHGDADALEGVFGDLDGLLGAGLLAFGGEKGHAGEGIFRGRSCRGRAGGSGLKGDHGHCLNTPAGTQLVAAWAVYVPLIAKCAMNGEPGQLRLLRRKRSGCLAGRRTVWDSVRLSGRLRRPGSRRTRLRGSSSSSRRSPRGWHLLPARSSGS